MKGATLGRVVLYHHQDGNTYPAIVSRVIPPTGLPVSAHPALGLHVMVPPAAADVEQARARNLGAGVVNAALAMLYVEPVYMGEGPGQWSWPLAVQC